MRMIMSEYDEYKTPEDYGYIQADSVPDTEMLRHFFKGVLESVYDTGEMVGLENCLEEMCELLEVDFPNIQPKLTKGE